MANAQMSGNSHPMPSLGDIYGNAYLRERFQSFIFPHTEEPVDDSRSKNNQESLSSSVALEPANPDSSPSSMKEVCSVSAQAKISIEVQQHKPIASSTHCKISNDETEHVVKYTGPSSLDYLSYFDKILPPSYQPEQSNFSIVQNLTTRADNSVLPVSSTVKNPYTKGASTTRTDSSVLPLSYTVKNPYAKSASTARTDQTALPLSTTVKNSYAKSASTTRTDKTVLALSSTVKNPYAKSASTARTDKNALALSSTVKNPYAKSASTTRADNAVKKRKKVPQTPAALNAQENWKLLNVSDANEIEFDYQNSFLDEFLTDRIQTTENSPLNCTVLQYSSTTDMAETVSVQLDESESASNQVNPDDSVDDDDDLPPYEDSDEEGHSEVVLQENDATIAPESILNAESVDIMALAKSLFTEEDPHISAEEQELIINSSVNTKQYEKTKRGIEQRFLILLMARKGGLFDILGLPYVGLCQVFRLTKREFFPQFTRKIHR
jgi:hypothetical protein